MIASPILAGLLIGVIGIGGLLLSVWGGPKRRINGVLIGLALSSLLGLTLLGLGQTTAVRAAGAYLTMFFIKRKLLGTPLHWVYGLPEQLFMSRPKGTSGGRALSRSRARRT